MAKKVVKYIILGQGLAGSLVASMLRARGESFVVINQTEKWSSSEVAAGVFNPLTGMRVVKTWLADDIFPYSKAFFEKEEQFFETTFLKSWPILKIFGSQEQQTDVLAKATERYKPYLDTNNDDKPFQGSINANYGTTEILQGGAVDVHLYTSKVREWLKAENNYVEATVQRNDIFIEENKIIVGEVEASHLICCEGYHSASFGLFNWLPFSVTKGEMLTIEADIPQTHIINKGCFLLPKGDRKFLVGASFERSANKKLTEEGKSFLTAKLDEILAVPYKIVDHVAGVRPTVKDRRPYLGNHPEYKNVSIFNGLGSKGVTLGPFFANHLLDFIENDIPIYQEVNINRYNASYKK